MRCILSLLFIINILFANAQLVSEPVSINTPTGILKGSLIVPKANIKKCHFIILIPGSGATDRNGNSGRDLTANSYLLLADSLATYNIATLLIDKRGIGESSSAKIKEADLRFQDYVTDAIAWINFLKQDKRCSKVFVAGHSEGSLIAMLATLQTSVNGYISIAGAGETIDKIISWQYEQQLPGTGKYVDSLFNRLKNNDTINKVPPLYAGIFRKTVQPYIRSWALVDPCATIKNVKVPAIIIQGTNDIQVTTQQAQILKDCNPKATLVFINGMNHILKAAPAERAANIATYSNANLPLMPGLSYHIAQFVNKR